MRSGQVACIVAVVAAAEVLSAQWLTYQTPGIPRSADGKPNLTAPAPKTSDGKPDLSGLWAPPCLNCSTSERHFFNLAKDLNAADVQMTPWAAAIAKQRQSRDHVDDPFGYCPPPGVPRIYFVIGAFRILQAANVTALFLGSSFGRSSACVR